MYKKEKLHLIAEAVGNWDYYLAPPFEDGSQAILYIAKPESGAASGIWCGVSSLRSHLKRLQSITNSKNLIPDNWTVKDHSFFENLGIN